MHDSHFILDCRLAVAASTMVVYDWGEQASDHRRNC